MSFLKNLSWTFLANAFSSMIKWLLIIAIAQKLTPIEVGSYSLALAVTAPIVLFADMRLRLLFVSDQEGNYFSFSKARKLTSILSFLVLITISFLLFSNYSAIIILVGISKLIDLQSEMLYAIPHKKSDMSLIAKLLIGKQFATFLPFLFLLISKSNLELSLLGYLIAQLLYVGLLESNIIKKRYNVIKSNNTIGIKAILKLGIPLGITQLIVSLNSSIPRYFLEAFQSAESLGYFSAIAYILVAGNLIMNPVAQNFLPLLTKKVINNDYYSFKKITLFYFPVISLVISLIPLLISIFVGEELLEIIYGAEYARYINVLNLLCWVLFNNCINWTFDISLMALKYISIQPIVSVIILFINLIVAPFLIIDYEILGAVFALIITSTLQFIIKGAFMYKRLLMLEGKPIEKTIED